MKILDKWWVWWGERGRPDHVVSIQGAHLRDSRYLGSLPRGWHRYTMAISRRFVHTPITSLVWALT